MHQPLRAFLVANMQLCLSALPSVPVDLLVEPLVKQVTTYGYTNADFDLFVEVSKHSTLHLRAGLRLLDLLGKVRCLRALRRPHKLPLIATTTACSPSSQACLHDPVFARLASLPFVTLVRRFHSEPAMHQYVQRFTQVALNMFVQHDENSSRDTPVDGDDAMDTAVRIRRVMVQEIIAKVALTGVRGPAPSSADRPDVVAWLLACGSRFSTWALLMCAPRCDHSFAALPPTTRWCMMAGRTPSSQPWSSSQIVPRRAHGERSAQQLVTPLVVEVLPLAHRQSGGGGGPRAALPSEGGAPANGASRGVTGGCLWTMMLLPTGTATQRRRLAARPRSLT